MATLVGWNLEQDLFEVAVNRSNDFRDETKEKSSMARNIVRRQDDFFFYFPRCRPACGGDMLL